MNIGLQIVGKTYQLYLTPETAEEKAITELLNGCERSHNFSTRREQLAVNQAGAIRIYPPEDCDKSLMFTFTEKPPSP